MDVILPNGQVIQGVPEGITKAELADKLKRNGMEVPAEWIEPPEAYKPKMADLPLAALQQTKDLLGGAVRGAGSIGATVLGPQDALNAYLMSKASGKKVEPTDRRSAMTEATRFMGANPDSMTYGLGKLGTEIAGTVGVGPALASVAPASLATPIATAGLRGSGFVPRAIGGMTTGAAAAGLVNPEDAKTGAMIGGALPVGAEAAKLGGKFLTHTLGLSTGVGAEPIRQAFKAGATQNQGFIDNIRGDVPLTNVLDDAKRGLEAMRNAKSAEYRSGMIPIKSDKTALVFDDIEQAIGKASDIATYKGQVKNPRAVNAVQQMRAAVDEWRQLDPAEFHTPEGMDALKQRLGAILEGIPFEERGARLAAGEVYSATKKTIEKQAPAYAKVMKDYHQASDQITEIERVMSLGKKSSDDTAMRKLQSLMRNNVQTNYGNRLNLAESLERQGGVELMPEIAGQALNSWTPRSLSGQLGAIGSAGLSTINPWMLGALPFQSPRLVGNAAYQLGRMSTENPTLLPMLYRAAPVVGTSDR